MALDDSEFAQLHPLEGGETELAREAHAAAADRGRILGRPRILHLGIEASALRTTHGPPPLCLLINREALDQRLDLVAHRSLGERILLDMLLRQYIEHLDDHVDDLAEFCDTEAARGTGGGAGPPRPRHPRAPW